jgi:3-hydroxyisobutyrate dehydrogenase-like beta-hydroxyacid dehydrogenase
MKGASMIERSFEPSFALKLAVKDAGLMVESARQHELDLPLITTIEQRLKAGLPDHADADLSVTFLTSAPAPTAS